MTEINLEQLKQLQIGILDVVVSFCEANNISYWLDCGTLLGAIRHNGYIPWDDDVDIGMLRPDFDRFILSFNESSERYEVKCIDTDPSFYYALAKVNDKKTILYEPDENGVKIAVNIDVIVYDNAPDDEQRLKKAYDKRDFYRNCNQLRVMHNKPNGGVLRQLGVRTLRMLLLPFPKSFFAKKLSENAKRYNSENTKGVGNFTSFERMYCEKGVFNSFLVHEFEGKQYKIPVGYDEWLRSFYGDYMKLPPEEKRVSHHRFKAYFIE